MSKSVGSYFDLKTNYVSQIKSFVSRAKALEDKEPLLQLESIREEDVELVVISTKPGLQTDGATSDPHSHPLGLSPFKLQYLKDIPAAVTSLSNLLKDNGFSCKFDLESDSVTIRACGEQNENQALQIIKDNILEMNFDSNQLEMMEDTLVFLPPCKQGGLQALVVKVGSMVKLVGLATDVKAFGDSLRASVDRLDAGASVTAGEMKEETIQMTESCFLYLCKYKWSELMTLLEKWPGVTLTHRRKRILLIGPCSAVDEALMVVRGEIDRVKEFEIKLGPKMNVAIVAEVAEEIGKKFKCTINFQPNFGVQEPAQIASPGPEIQFPSLSLSVLDLKETRVKVVMNTLEKQQAHVIVNTSNTKLDLQQGRGVSWCILQAAGPIIQTEVTRKYPTGIQHGEVAESGHGNIKTCKAIYHGALPPFPKDRSGPDYQKQENECFKCMVELVFNCLIKAASSLEGYMTIALPALGTGFLEYPAQYVVQLMYIAIRLFKDDKRSGRIKEIIIVIHPDAKLEVKQMFLAHRQTHKLKTRHVATIDEMREEYRKEDKDDIQMCEFRVVIGSSLLQIVNGVIHDACEVSEVVLVLWSDQEIRNPDTNLGLKCLDPEQKTWKCSSYVNELDDVKCVVDSTNLRRRTLIHSYCKDCSQKSITEGIVEGLKKAVTIKCNTITIPVVSDSHLAVKPRLLAQMIINAVAVAKANVYVVTVVIEESGIFESFSDKVATVVPKLLPPADVDKSPVAVDIWKKTHAEKASKSQAALQVLMTMTNEYSVLVITSDSDDKNKKVAEEVQEKLAVKLQVVIKRDTTC